MIETLLDLPRHVPTWFVVTWLVLLGLVLGSFLNVVIHRLPRGESVVRPRSACPGCGRKLPWHENVPVLSWLLLRGRCAGCGRRISARYAVVEMLAAGLLVSCFAAFGWSAALPIAALFSLMVLALLFTDLEHMVLPDAITLPGAFVGLSLSWVNPIVGRSAANALAGVLVSVFVLEGLNLAYRILRGRDGFGAGDTKMMMLVGAFLGWRLALFTILAGSLIGALVAVPALAAARWRERRSTGSETDSGAEPVQEGASRQASPDAAEPQEPGRAGAGPPSPADGDAADGDEQPVERGGASAAERRPSVLEELAPRTPEEALAPLTYAALGLSFLLPHVTPSSSLAGLLVGLVVMKAGAWGADRFRGGQRPQGGVARAAEAWPLLGAVLGLPPSPASALAALAVGLLVALGLTVLRPVFPGAPPPGPERPDEDDALGPAPFMQAELPFGVFLAIAAIASLFAGEELIDWYVAVALGRVPPG